MKRAERAIQLIQHIHQMVMTVLLRIGLEATPLLF